MIKRFYSVFIWSLNNYCRNQSKI